MVVIPSVATRYEILQMFPDDYVGVIVVRTYFKISKKISKILEMEV